MAKFNNLAARASVTVIGIPLAVYLLYLGGSPLFIFLAVLSVLANDEFLRLQGLTGIAHRIFMHAVLLGILASASQYRFDILILLFLLVFIWNSNSLLLKRIPEFSRIHNLSLASLIYPGLAVATILSLRELPKHAHLDYGIGFTVLVLLLAAIWICDSLAYFFGSAYGDTKLFPSVSPNKSWEGAVAGFLGALTLMLAAWKLELLPGFILADYIVLAAASGILGQLGDLVESKYKRELGIKDSSSILPGHGGLWDRLDSIAMAVPVTWGYLYLRFIVF